MKNNYIKYGLIIVVIFIYGRLIVNYSGVLDSHEDDIKIAFVEKLYIEKMDEEYELNLNYTDPFLGQIGYSTPNLINIAPSPSIQIEEKIQQPTILPKVKYKGLVKNKKSDLKTGLLSINGKSFLINQGKSYQDIKVISFNDIQCSYIFAGVSYEIEK